MNNLIPLTHILKGRSIDGTVYRTDYGWTPSIYEATWYTMDEAHVHLQEQLTRNMKVELDNKIGQLETILIPEKVKIRHRLIEYLVEGNSREDLAAHLCEALSKEQYEQLIQEMNNSMMFFEGDGQ